MRNAFPGPVPTLATAGRVWDWPGRPWSVAAKSPHLTENVLALFQHVPNPVGSLPFRWSQAGAADASTARAAGYGPTGRYRVLPAQWTTAKGIASDGMYADELKTSSARSAVKPSPRLSERT